MKRIMAAIIACSIMAGACASCGSSGSSSNNDSKVSASTQASSASYAGKWEWGKGKCLNITELGIVRLEGNISGASMIVFNKDGSGKLDGNEFGPGQFDFDGETYRLHVSDDNDMTLHRLEPNNGTEFYGKYELVSGTLYNSIESGYNNRAAEKGSDVTLDMEGMSILMDIGENKTDIAMLSTIGKILDDEIIININGISVGGKFTVDGDVMTINSSNGKTTELKRVK